jgi:hypothetical protein
LVAIKWTLRDKEGSGWKGGGEMDEGNHVGEVREGRRE